MTMRHAVRAAALLLSAGVVGSGGSYRVLWAQAPTADPADVGTIPDLIRASYEVISGPAGAPRQWRRDSTLYMPGATFVAMGQEAGRPRARILTPEEFRRATDAHLVAEGLIESEIASRTERFGNVAQVRSVYEMRRTRNGPMTGRGVNYFQLYWDGDRWWIASIVWDDERPGNPLPGPWTRGHETVPPR
jgi:hypothetical protein